MISFDDFSKLELKVGIVVDAEDIEGSEKLLKLKIDLGEEQPRQILAGVKQWYVPQDFIGKQVIIVANLETKIMMGLESQGMMLAAESEAGPIFLTTSKPAVSGAKIR